MVAILSINKVIKELEKFLIKQSDFRVDGLKYDLILFVPTDLYSHSYTIIVSAKKLNQLSQREIIEKLFLFFKETLDADEYDAITRINILNTEDNLVKNLNFMYGVYKQPIEIQNMAIGGVEIENATLIKSVNLEKLVVNKHLTLLLTDGSTVDIIFKGIEKNFNLSFEPGKAGLQQNTFGVERETIYYDDIEMVM